MWSRAVAHQQKNSDLAESSSCRLQVIRRETASDISVSPIRMFVQITCLAAREHHRDAVGPDLYRPASRRTADERHSQQYRADKKCRRARRSESINAWTNYSESIKAWINYSESIKAWTNYSESIKAWTNYSELIKARTNYSESIKAWTNLRSDPEPQMKGSFICARTIRRKFPTDGQLFKSQIIQSFCWCSGGGFL